MKGFRQAAQLVRAFSPLTVFINPLVVQSIDRINEIQITVDSSDPE